MSEEIPVLPPKGTRTSKMTPEQLEAFKENRRKYSREWAKANYKRLYEKRKERMLVDPEYAERVRLYAQKTSIKKWDRLKQNETAEQRVKRLQRNRECKAKRYREWRLANPIQPRPPKKEKPKAKPVMNAKPKPGRILSSLGWR